MASEDTIVVTTREDLHSAITAGYTRGKALIADGKRVVVTVAEDEDALTTLQLRFFHGPVLSQLSEQATVDGRRYTREVWKRHLKNVILEREPVFKEMLLIGKTEPEPVRIWWSLRDMGVKRMSKFIDEVIAMAMTEWRVEFRFLVGERDAVRYPPPHYTGPKAKETAKC